MQIYNTNFIFNKCSSPFTPFSISKAEIIPFIPQKGDVMTNG